MLKQDIEALRQKLNSLIAEGHNYDEIYSVSVALDELIAEFYKESC
ncbi:aspartyl-phosphate phosphatase Spo0E family protein [Thermotalea metallivorans]|nr:aspartyl-phosphate phosphatase Spo0E family protein [Thermotalea metallivorans]